MNISNIKNGLERRRWNTKKWAFQTWLKLSKNPRPTSSPYISADSFRAIADHVFDYVDEKTKVPDVKTGDIIYINSDDSQKFFTQIHPKINNPYILISHWGIKPFGTSLIPYLDNKIIHVFAKNALVAHPKVTSLPIGLEDLHRYNAGVVGEFDKLRKKKINKKEKILFDFKIATNKVERQKASDFLTSSRFAEKPENKLPPWKYHELLQQYMFVASPPGAGRECHRTWEAIYLKTIPVVKRSYCEEYFESIGAPIWVVDDWEELKEVNLPQKYKEIIARSNSDIIWMNYWINRIDNYKKN